MQQRHNSSALAMELHLSCTNPQYEVITTCFLPCSLHIPFHYMSQVLFVPRVDCILWVLETLDELQYGILHHICRQVQVKSWENASYFVATIMDSKICSVSTQKGWLQVIMVSLLPYDPSSAHNSVELYLSLPCPSVCPSVDRIVSTLYLQQYFNNTLDPFDICTSYKADVSRVKFVSK